MNTFIAYLDILGFKQFIQNNSKEYVKRNMHNLNREVERAGTNVLREARPGLAVPDLEHARVNCLQVSDSVMFWTKDDSEDSFRALFKTVYKFLAETLLTTFPFRGCITHGDIEFQPFSINTANGLTYNNASLYGEALISAYESAENQDWAGSFVHQRAVEVVGPEVIDKLIQSGHLIQYPVPLKDDTEKEEFVITPVQMGINETLHGNMIKRVQQAFSRHMGGMKIDEQVIRKQENTLSLLKQLRNPK